VANLEPGLDWLRKKLEGRSAISQEYPMRPFCCPFCLMRMTIPLAGDPSFKKE